MRRNNVLSTIVLLLFAIDVQSQQLIVGKVTNASDGKAIGSVSVKVKGSDLGKTTGTDGVFKLNVPNNVILVIEHIGFASQTINLSLPKLDTLRIGLVANYQQLDEVTVSTGYQQLNKERATGSFVQLSEKQLANQVGSNILNRLEGIASGLQVDRTNSAQARIAVRGQSTINGPRDVLIILDNFPFEGNIEEINPNDVESITILKDAAAASIWGTRAGNGVIVITTKKGKYNQNLQLNFQANANYGFEPDLFKRKQMSVADYIDLEVMLYSTGRYTADINSPNKVALSPVVELLAGANGNYNAVAGQIEALKGYDVRRDFKRYFYQASFAQQYALQANAGTDRFKWYLSGGYDRQTGNLQEQNDRLTLRFRQEFKIVDGLKLETGLGLTSSSSRSGKSGFNQVITNAGSLYPYARLADENGGALPIAKDYTSRFTNGAGLANVLDWNYYPLTDDDNRRGLSSGIGILALTALNYDLNENIKLSLNYQYERQSSATETDFNEQSYFTRNQINLFTQLDANGSVVRNVVPIGGILDNSDRLFKTQQYRAQGNFQKTWGHHQVYALAGGEYRSNESSSKNNRLYGYDASSLNSSNVDFANPYPTLVTGGAAYLVNGENRELLNNRFISFFSNLSYTFKNRYTASGSVRRDASNLFGVNTNDKWKPLWSAGISWITSNEAFFKMKAVDQLKLRLTYGSSGNIDPSKTALVTIRYGANSIYTQSPYALIDKIFNPDLKWEVVHTLNSGIDFSLWKGRISGSVEYYRKKASDLFGFYPIDYTSGVGAFAIRNVASMQATGVDVQLNFIPVRGKLTWQSQMNWSHYQDKITDYYLASRQGSSFINGTVIQISSLVGKPVYPVFSYPFAGLDPANGDPNGYVNGVVSKNYQAITGTATTVDDLQYHGSAKPTMFGNWGNTFSYKKWELSVQLVFKLGYYFRRESVNYGALINQGRLAPDYGDRWQKAGDEQITQVPSFVYPNVAARDNFYAGSSALVEKADHIRLHQINLSRNFKVGKSEGRGLKTINAFVNMSNLGVLWVANKQGIDPDYASLTQLLPSRTLAIGLRANY